MLNAKYTHEGLNDMRTFIQRLKSEGFSGRLKEIAEEVADFIIKELDKTVANWKGGAGVPTHGNRPYNRKIHPKPNFAYSISITGKSSVSIDFTTDSKLWKWLDEGTPDVKVTRPEGITYLPRTKTRTRKRKLEVEEEAQYGDHLVHLPKGYTRYGFQGREWTEEAAQRARDHFKSKYPDLEITLTITGPAD